MTMDSENNKSLYLQTQRSMKMIEKIKSLTFYLLFFISASFAADWTGASIEPETIKNIDGKMFYMITRVEELAWFADQVNAGKTTINAQLANDIKFMEDTTKRSRINWTPIGKDSSVMFNGVFDGAGRTIYGLYCAKAYFAGIFGVTDKDAEIKNIKFKSSSIRVWSEGYAGGIVAVNWGTVKACVNSDSVSSSYSNSGGVVGENNGSVIACINKGPVISSPKGSNYSGGGVVGKNNGSVENCVNEGFVYTFTDHNSSGYFVQYRYSGGIVGRNEGVVTNCVNNGEVSFRSPYSSEYSYLGGITGWNSGSIKECINSGSLSSIFSKTSVDTSNYLYSGGIAGWNNGLINICSNDGSVNSSSLGKGYSGGIVGLNANKGHLKNCRNLGMVSKSVKYSGGIIGSDYSAMMYNSFSAGNSALSGVVFWTVLADRNFCYYDSDVLKKLSTESPNIGLHTEDMQNDRFAWVLNTKNGENVNSSVWSRDSVGYPIFADSLHKPIYKVVFDDEKDSVVRFTNYKGLVPFPKDPEPPIGKLFAGWITKDGFKVNGATVFSKDQVVYADYMDALDIYFSIRFFDSDSTLLDSQYVQYGVIPNISKLPSKPSTAQYSYSFTGWNKEPSTAVANFDYYAVYSEKLRSYTVSFFDYDGSELQTSNYLYGAIPDIPKSPSRSSSIAYDYVFVGWNPAIDSVFGETFYTALYDSAKIKYTVTFMNGDSVFAKLDVPYGESAVSPGDPLRIGYRFVGWDDSLLNITGDRTVNAIFEEIVYYRVVVNFENYKLDTSMVEEGMSFTLPAAPEKVGYSFSGWYNSAGCYLGEEGKIISVTSNIWIVAQFTVNFYEIVFKNGSEILQSGKLAYGEKPIYIGKLPTKAADAQSAYEFVGWSPKISKVVGNAVYSAVFEKSSALVANLPSPAWSVTASGGNFLLHTAPVGKPYALFDLQGKVLAKGRIESSEMTISAPRAGSYIVRIGNHSVRMNAK